ncbi:hypothetical protein OCHUTO_0535 [Orientia chuto str. Dubai]|uniref:Uncharacterized protein n=1 Tax=Orientia chuto str. Dubai TaxID=1359168 RepID=A0A0F3MLF0_9RICK|nr:hypothetical protein [Candidatus Orientia mediorientalis]KJV56292.1 hypothetical protein OCHUTO_0535 [Orientia chuto str. Dubai]
MMKAITLKTLVPQFGQVNGLSQAEKINIDTAIKQILQELNLLNEQ